MKLSDCMLVMIVIGLALFAGSFFYPQLSGSREAQWTDEDAEEMVELSRQAHGLDSAYGAERSRNPNAQPSPELARVADSWLAKDQELKDAQAAGQGVARAMFISGLCLVVLGGIVYLATNGSGGD